MADIVTNNFCKLEHILHPASNDDCGTARLDTIRANAHSKVVTSIAPTLQSDISVLKSPYRLDFVLETDRLRSYDDWPISINQRPKELSDAGFFYTGSGDKVKCFYCSGGLKDWEQGDDPWEQHAMWYDDCEYLKLMKGLIYIEDVKRSNKQALSSVSISPVLQNTVEALDVKFAKLCKICIIKKKKQKKNHTTFFPCGHVQTCSKCSK